MTNVKFIHTDGREIMIDRVQIYGTDRCVYIAYERTSFCGDHSSVQSECLGDEVIWWGSVKTLRLPEDLDALPAYSDERVNAVRAWRDRKYLECYDLILTAHPELSGCRMSCGEIETI